MTNVKLFFDESGTNNGNKLSLMGGLLIPEKLYFSETFKNLNNDLRQRKYNLHWKDFKGDSREKRVYQEVINIFSKYSSLCSFNVIHYHLPPNSNQSDLKEMFYSKLPERVLYGLLRSQPEYNGVSADIYIEFSTEYEKLGIKESLPKSMNYQALYRGHKFNINSCSYSNKHEEIGVELSDVILGIIRNIIENSNDSKRLEKKNELIVEFLKNDSFKNFLCNIKFFEWKNSDNLHKVDFSNYVNSFLASQSTWIEYISDEKKVDPKKESTSHLIQLRGRNSKRVVNYPKRKKCLVKL